MLLALCSWGYCLMHSGFNKSVLTLWHDDALFDICINMTNLRHKSLIHLKQGVQLIWVFFLYGWIIKYRRHSRIWQCARYMIQWIQWICWPVQNSKRIPSPMFSAILHFLFLNTFLVIVSLYVYKLLFISGSLHSFKAFTWFSFRSDRIFFARNFIGASWGGVNLTFFPSNIKIARHKVYLKSL